MSQSISVSHLTFQLKALIEGDFATYSVHGEISGLRFSSKGTLFFTLKDEWAAITVIFFQSHNIAIQPENGMQVVVEGTLSLYAKQGTYSLVGKKITPLGKGDIFAKLIALKEKLSQEGVFDPTHKPPIPPLPRRIAVITSPHGAAIKDICFVLEQSPVHLYITTVPVMVQGEKAPPSIVQMIEETAQQDFDLIILGRGGGSFEDLLPFSNEAVVRAVAASSIPIISAVGHEIDQVLCDLAASHIAPTPTAGAQRVIDTLQATLTRYRQQVNMLERRIISLLQHWHHQLSFFPELLQRSYTSHYHHASMHISQLKDQLDHGMQQKLNATKQTLQILTPLLKSLSPAAILLRGYAKIYRNQKIVTSIVQLSSKDKITLHLHDGIARSTVDEIEVGHDI